MFRFINTGLKQSVTTFPNSIYHSPSVHKKFADDENENKKHIETFNNFDQTLCLYNRTQNNQTASYCEYNNLILERKNFVEFSFHFTEIKIKKSNQFNDFLLHLTPFSINKLINNFNIPKWIDCKPIEIECQPKLQSKTVNDVKKCTLTTKTEKKVINSNEEENVDKFNFLGHELNTKGCNAATIHDLSTALQYWNCAATLNYPPAQFNLGVHYENKKDFKNAEKWYRSAVQLGDHPIAAYNLAILLNNKLDASLKDEIKDLFILSADQGSEEAQKCVDCINNC